MTRALNKAARLLVLGRLQATGVLEGLTLQETADIFGVNRSTIHRDFKELAAVEAEYARLMDQQPWIPSAPD